MKINRWLTALGASSLLVAGGQVFADTTIEVDGLLGDWPTSGFTFLDGEAKPPQKFLDIEQVWVTNDNTSGSNGFLYIGLLFAGKYTPANGSNDLDLFIYLDVDGDGVIGGSADRIIEATSGTVTDGAGIPVGNISEFDYSGSGVEVSIPYSVLGLTHGSDTFGVAFATGELGSKVDIVPSPEGGGAPFITYDGAAGDDIEPLAVTLAEVTAEAGRAGVELRWSTATERNNLGFLALRRAAFGEWVPLTDSLLPGLGSSGQGQAYSVVDPKGKPGSRYLLADLDASGRWALHGPFVAKRAVGRARVVRAVKAPAKPHPRTVSPGSPRPRALRGLRRPMAPGKSLADERAELRVSVAGPQRIAWSSLEAAGWSRDLVKRRGLGLFRDVGPVAALPIRDGWLFVGAPRADRYADHEILRARLGVRVAMPERQVTADCGPSALTLRATAEASEAHIYYVASPVEDPFYWAWAFPGYPARLSFGVEAPAPGVAELTVRVTGLTAEHAVELQLNGIELGRVAWTGKDLEELRVNVPEDAVLEGENSLKLDVMAQAGFDLVYVDGMRLDYPRRPELRSSPLTFSVADGECVTVTGLADPGEAVLVDVTEPLRPEALVGFSRHVGPGGVGSVRFRDERARDERRYVLIDSPGALPEPELIGLAAAPGLADRNQAADYLIVVHPDLRAAAERLASVHETRGLMTKVVTTEEVYSQFSHGRPGPNAIRALVRTAHARWRRAPDYVLLLGGSTVDSLGALAESPADLVPTPFWRTSAFGYEAASDGWYVADDTGQPLAAIGRLAVRSADEADAVVDKLIRSLDTMATPLGRALLVADSYQADGTTTEFERAADRLAAVCLEGTTVTAERFFKSRQPQPASALLDAARAGTDLLTYRGHAYLSGWSSAPTLVDVPRAGSWDNTRPFWLLSFTCFDGAFTGPWGESLATAFVNNPDGGALLATAGSTLSDPMALSALSEHLLCGLVSGEAPTVGDALRDAKADLLASGGLQLDDLLFTYNLLGDPATPNPWFVP